MVKISNDYITSLIAMLQSVYLVDRIATTDYDAINESNFL